MCLIIKNLEGKQIPFSVIRAAVKQNKDGFGRLDLPSGRVRRTLDMKEAQKMAMEPGKCVMHFRLGTAGTKGVENVHPFEITKNWLLFHNGTMNSLNGKVRSDSANLAKLLGSMNRKDWDEAFDILGENNRFLAIHRRTGEFVQHGDAWTQKDGIWYSNGYHFRSDTMVALYDNFTDGCIMNKELGIRKVDFVASGVTADKHRLCIPGGMPFLLEGSGAHNGEPRGNRQLLEVYEVSDNVLEKLDKVHHHPGFYERKLVEIETEGEGSLWAYVYFCTDERMDDGKYFYWTDPKNKSTDIVSLDKDDYEEFPFHGTIYDGTGGYTTSDTKSRVGSALTVVEKDEEESGKPKEEDVKERLFMSDAVVEDGEEDDDRQDTFTRDKLGAFSDQEIAALAEVDIYFLPDAEEGKPRFIDSDGDLFSDERVMKWVEVGAVFGRAGAKYDA